MSQTDTFINEVTEAVRRDKLFAFFRRWAWLAVLIVILIVGGAAWYEYRRATDRNAAEALGDAIIGALAAEDAAARAEGLAEIDADGAGASVVAMIEATQLAAAGERDAALAELEPVAQGGGLAPRYADLAELKRVLLAEPPLEPAARITALEPLTTPGAPYRLLAQEQIALAEIAQGERDQALAILQGILADSELTQDLRQRVSQLIVALGGEIGTG